MAIGPKPVPAQRSGGRPAAPLPDPRPSQPFDRPGNDVPEREVPQPGRDVPPARPDPGEFER